MNISDIISLGAFLLSAIAVSIAFHQGSKANKISKKANIIALEANETAEKAGKMAEEAHAMFSREHKQKILPNLIMTIPIVETSLNADYDDVIVLAIKNTAHGKATITNVEGFGQFIVTNLSKNKIVFPITLSYNTNTRMQLTLPTGIKAQYLFDKDKLEHQYQIMLTQLVLLINFSNEIGTKYEVQLRFDSEVNIYQGAPYEVD